MNSEIKITLLKKIYEISSKESYATFLGSYDEMDVTRASFLGVTYYTLFYFNRNAIIDVLPGDNIKILVDGYINFEEDEDIEYLAKVIEVKHYIDE